MEAVAVVGEAFLSAALSVLLKKLSSVKLLKFAGEEQVQAELKKWERYLRKVHAVLEDAEEKQITDSSVKIWLSELRDLAYDIEDVLDELATETLRRKVMSEPRASTSKVGKCLPSCCTGLSSDAMKFNFEMETQLQEITAKLNEIEAEKNKLNLSEAAGGRSRRTRKRLPTTSLVNEAHVYGRDDDKAAILELLLRGESSNPEVSVIPIVGMGGLGKTTLAQLVYNDVKVMSYFDLRAWVCVSEDFDVVRITKTILEAVTYESWDTNDLNLLQTKVKEHLSKKKFLLVLDDVWNEDYEYWTVLRRPFEVGPSGSKIIITTRNQGVSSMIGTGPSYQLKELLFVESLSLLSWHALGKENFDGYPNLQDIGEEIVKRCKGLPLAAKTLGGLLRNKLTHSHWQSVLNSKIWEVAEEKSGILPALRLSYYHLPSELKPCFVYCSLFPKDYEFDKDELVLLWMAEGFIQQPKGMKQVEDLGGEYFNELLSRSFFQQSSRYESKFVMHDLINDLARSAAGDLCLVMEKNLENDGQNNLEKARHFSFVRSKYEISQRFEGLHKMKHLRSFISLPDSHDSWCYFSRKIFEELLQKSRKVRVLCLHNYLIRGLPNLIGELKHLRYMNLSFAEFESLPESVSTLYNLQTLILCYCRNLTALPSGIGNLINLHHLDITNTPGLLEMPPGMGNLTSLQTLPKFIVGKANRGLRIRELENLLHLRKELSISGLNHVEDIRDVKVAYLKGKCGLDKLGLQWNDDFPDSRDKTKEMKVLELLQPHKNLKGLSIEFYGGSEFPSWVRDPIFDNLVQLKLRGCRRSTSLPTLGRLPLLKDLCIEAMNAVKTVGPEFFSRDGLTSTSVKPFLSLKILRLADMEEWEEWHSSPGVEQEDVRQFPSLDELKILNCPKLVGKLPKLLPSLKKLEIRKCPLLTGSLSRLPSLRELKVEECDEAVLKSLHDATSLTTLTICKISNLICLEEGCLPCNLQELELIDCDNLKKVPNDLHGLQSLKKLIIRRCPKFMSFPTTGLPYNLRYLELEDCEAVDSFPDGIMMAQSNGSNQCVLEELAIKKCPSLKSFPSGLELPTTLKWLIIEDCENLQFLPKGIMYEDVGSNKLESALMVLEIRDCSSLLSLPTGRFPTSLEMIIVEGCRQLESVFERMPQNNARLEFVSIERWTNLKSFPLDFECLHNLTHLTHLYIVECPALESFPESGLPIPNLQILSIRSCENLKSLPNQMDNLMSLISLYISDCPGLVSIPQGGFSPNLTILNIGNCESLKQPLSEWGLHKLTSLSELSIVNAGPPDIVSFPDDDCIIPTSITWLWIAKFGSLEFLSRGILDLITLKELYIAECPKLRAFPKEGLPSSLGCLVIEDCPILKEHCLKDKGEYWPTIADIPFVQIDDTYIYG